MSYHIHTTDAIIIKRIPTGEANALYYILTRDLGCITATAQGVRLGHSKLKSALTEYSSVLLSCIVGKRGWKITNAISKKNYFFSKTKSEEVFVARIASLILHMMPGEVRDERIFDVVSFAFDTISTLTPTDRPHFEMVIVLQILFFLGYVEKTVLTQPLIDTPWSDDLSQYVSLNTADILAVINKALKESHL